MLYEYKLSPEDLNKCIFLFYIYCALCTPFLVLVHWICNNTKIILGLTIKEVSLLNEIRRLIIKIGLV
jgi:hypothetical protein